MISQIAYMNKIPVYVIADSWKFTKNKVPIEQRKLNEIWDNAPKNIRLKNPAFEFVPKKYIKNTLDLCLDGQGDLEGRVIDHFN